MANLLWPPLISMNFFQIVKLILDESFQLIPAKDDDERYKCIEAELEILRTSYANVVSGHCIDYAKPVTRFAYIYKYVVSHASMVAEILGRSSTLSALFKKDSVDISCVGGGPGSDFLGVIKYCIKAGLSPALEVRILDKNPVWSESWSDIRKRVKGVIDISPSFSTFDVTDAGSWKNYVKHLQADLFTFVYFMSEIYALKAKAEAYFDYLFSAAKSGAVFLFLDNRSRETYGWFDELAARHKLVVKFSREENLSLPMSEQCRDLGVFYTKLSNPKVTGKIAFRVAIKP